jgi:hypothetical protein
MQPSPWHQERVDAAMHHVFTLPGISKFIWPRSPDGFLTDVHDTTTANLIKVDSSLAPHGEPWQVTKADTVDILPPLFPKWTSPESVLAELAERTIAKVWASLITRDSTISRQNSLAAVINLQVSPAFSALGDRAALEQEFLDARLHFMKSIREGDSRFARLGWLGMNGWPLHHTMGLLERMEEIRAGGELDAALLHPIHAELLHWMPLILARLEEIAAEPGATSQRLAAAITTMRQRIPRLRQLQAAAQSSR